MNDLCNYNYTYYSDVASKAEKKELTEKINASEETVHAMEIAMKSMNKFNSSFAEGLYA